MNKQTLCYKRCYNKQRYDGNKHEELNTDFIKFVAVKRIIQKQAITL